MDGRLAAAWAALRAAGRPALIPYITAGHPDRRITAEMLAGAGGAGADCIELGIPWSDPVADGPVIQASCHAALGAGMTLAGALALLAAVRPGIPVVIMSYLNPLLRYGPARFAADARAAGAAALLVTDLPAGADPAVESALRGSGLPLVRLVAPTTTPARLAAIASRAEGFVYLVARTGVTGAGAGLDTALARQVAAVRASTPLPVVLGFGIATADQAAEAARLADGVVVGSVLVRRLEEGGTAAGLALVRELRAALDGARRVAA